MQKHKVVETISTHGWVIVECACGWTHSESRFSTFAVTARERCRLAYKEHKQAAVRANAALRGAGYWQQMKSGEPIAPPEQRYKVPTLEEIAAAEGDLEKLARQNAARVTATVTCSANCTDTHDTITKGR